jgi:hypothetical protein
MDFANIHLTKELSDKAEVYKRLIALTLVSEHFDGKIRYV